MRRLTNHSRRFLGSLLTLLLAVAVLIACNTSQSLPFGYITPPVSPLPLPTRQPTPTAIPLEFWLERLQLALLQDEHYLPEAETAWEAALQLAPEAAVVYREGARLALRQRALEAAAERINRALQRDSQDAEAWLLAGVIAQQLGDLNTMQEAFHMAETLDPTLADALFPTRWHAALATGDGELLGRLAQQYLLRHLDHPYAAYYRAEALLATGYPQNALELLLLRMHSESPGVLWYTLGRVYLALEAPSHAITALEVANAALSRGDESLYLASDDPTRDVSLALGHAYLAAQRCDEAQRRLALLATPYPQAAALLEEAQRCPPPRPTPTFTPWLP